MRSGIGWIMILVGVAATACGDATTPDGSSLAPNEVAVLDNRFDPSQLDVVEGTTVTWLWRGSNLHNVTFDAPTLTGSDSQTDGQFSVAFTEPGTYAYYCSIHGRAIMAGQVVVAREGGPTD